MGEFVCRVADSEGRVFSHVEAASSPDEARQKLADRGLYIYSVDRGAAGLSASFDGEATARSAARNFSS